MTRPEDSSGTAAPESGGNKISGASAMKQPHLSNQSLDNLDVTKLHPLTPEVISRQATINIGTIGHVAHGKSTLVKAISGVQTVRFKNEKERNITIKLGYANAKIYKLTEPKSNSEKNTDDETTDKTAITDSTTTTSVNGDEEKKGLNSSGDASTLASSAEAAVATTGSSSASAEEQEQKPGRYTSRRSDTADSFETDEGKWTLQRHVSFVDCPGHDIFMATMLNGAAVMDAALLLVAGNESCPQPQTSEHLAAVEIMRMNHILILQNKIDLVKEEQAHKQYGEIKEFVFGTVAHGAPIVPISAVLKFNIDVVCEYLCTKIPVPVRDFTSAPRLIVIRSFDVNKPGEECHTLKGGVAGGSILHGVLRVGDEIEVRPGIVTKDKAGKVSGFKPIYSRVVSLFAEQNDLMYAVPGGLIGVGTLIDPTLTRADRL
eukprot:g2920.t1